MPWGRVDDSHYDHDKVLRMPIEVRNAADGLYWRAISYCNAKLTDGFVPDAVVAHLNGTPDQVAALVKVRLWHHVKGGFRVHDFSDFNHTRDEVETARAKKVEAGRLGGLKSGAARRTHETNQKSKQNRSTREAGASPSKREARATPVLELPTESTSTAVEAEIPPPNPPRQRGGQRNGRGRVSTTDYDALMVTDEPGPEPKTEDWFGSTPTKATA
jgi:hypothetical protein